MVKDISDITTGFSLSGPNSHALLQRLTSDDISSKALPFLGCKALDVGLHSTRVGRLSVVGELGYEINCSSVEHARLRKILLEAGKDLGVVEYGYNALLSMRLEKSFGIWSAEFRQGYTPGMTGMDRFIAFDKGDFVGREPALRERDEGAKTVLVTLEIDAADADASGYEPVWHGGRRVGYITSGGYGHTIGKSLALALVERIASIPGTELTVHVVGQERKARVIPASPYDPESKAMRVRM